MTNFSTHISTDNLKNQKRIKYCRKKYERNANGIWKCYWELGNIFEASGSIPEKQQNDLNPRGCCRSPAELCPFFILCTKNNSRYLSMGYPKIGSYGCCKWTICIFLIWRWSGTVAWSFIVQNSFLFEYWRKYKNLLINTQLMNCSMVVSNR